VTPLSFGRGDEGGCLAQAVAKSAAGQVAVVDQQREAPALEFGFVDAADLVLRMMRDVVGGLRPRYSPASFWAPFSC